MFDRSLSILNSQAKAGNGYDPLTQNPDGTSKDVRIAIQTGVYSYLEKKTYSSLNIFRRWFACSWN